MNHIQLVASRMRELRLRHGLTQIECSELTGFSHKFYQKLESGQKKQIWLETVERLASAFGLEIWEFLSPDLPEVSRLARPVVGRSVRVTVGRRGPYLVNERASAPRRGQSGRRRETKRTKGT